MHVLDESVCDIMAAYDVSFSIGEGLRPDSIANAMNPLDRQKLDVVNKTRSNLFGWRGQFTPRLANVSGVS